MSFSEPEKKKKNYSLQQKRAISLKLFKIVSPLNICIISKLASRLLHSNLQTWHINGNQFKRHYITSTLYPRKKTLLLFLSVMFDIMLNDIRGLTWELSSTLSSTIKENEN